MKPASMGVCDVGFFFQAEDGIRDADVTGVQTCALPICSRVAPWRRPASGTSRASSRSVTTSTRLFDHCSSRRRLTAMAEFSDIKMPVLYLRSEERRVGKSVELGGRRSINKNKICNTYSQ